jgi:membrane associated rhomboid family serine protease
MTATPVGMRCPECARQRTRVVRGIPGFGSGAGRVTEILIGANVLAFLAELGGGAGLMSGGGSVYFDFALFGPAVDAGEWYRIITSGFLHYGLIHLGLNMFVLYLLGNLIEPALGTWRFLSVYLVSLLGGSFGALLLSPNAVTVGASGAVFGLMAASFLFARQRGLTQLASQLGVLVLINLLFTFSVSSISVGGHLGGLVAGGLAGAALLAAERRRGSERLAIEAVALLALGAAAFVGALLAAEGSAQPMLVPPGVG